MSSCPDYSSLWIHAVILRGVVLFDSAGNRDGVAGHRLGSIGDGGGDGGCGDAARLNHRPPGGAGAPAEPATRVRRTRAPQRAHGGGRVAVTIRRLREDLQACNDKHHDAGTSDFLTGLMEQHEKMGWMLRSLLEK